MSSGSAKKKQKLKPLTVRISEDESKVLKEYCSKTCRTQTNIIRGFIRGLKDI